MQTNNSSQIIELRLPIISSQDYLLKNEDIIVNFGNAGGKISTYERKENLIYKGVIYFQEIGMRQINNLLAIKNNKILDLSYFQNYNNFNYHASNTFFQLEYDLEEWENLSEQLLLREPYEKTLSIFLDCSKINKSNYQEINYKYKKERWLKIIVHPLAYEIKEEVYWLPEAGESLKLSIEQDSEENFGFYGNELLYPVSESRIKELSEPYSAKTIYSINTNEHKIGNSSVERIILALEKLSGVTAWKTGENSIADIKYKWDLVINFNNKYYPLQVKSSYSQAVDSYEEYELLWENGEIPFLPVIIWLRANSCPDKIANCFSKLLNVTFKNSSTPSSQTRTFKKLYQKWVSKLKSDARQGLWNKEAEDSLQTLVDESNNKDKLIHFCFLLAEVRTIQAEALKNLDK